MIKTLKIFLATVLVCLLGTNIYGQTGTLVGTITDKSTNEPLPGANVVVKGTTIGTVTDVNGQFQLANIPAGEVTLVASFIGYIPQTQVLRVDANQTVTFNFQLAVDQQQLSDVVVIGYGTVKKSDATGSVVAVDSKDFNKGAITSPQDLMVGKSAGVVITNGDGAPGSAAQIRIRGGSSVTASNDPLIVIDGFPVDSKGIQGMPNPLATINPNDIETFTVLKDASATAIYGSRASNGVILITTKKGKSGQKMKISYNGNTSISTVPKFVSVFSGDEFRTLVKEKYAGNSAVISLLGNENTDWQKEIYRTAFSHDHNVGVAGVIKDVPYRASLGYTNQNGVLKSTNMERTTLAISADPSFFNNHLKININLKGMITNNNFGNTGAIGSAVDFDPTQPIYDAKSKYGGYFTWIKQENGVWIPNSNATSNPVALIEQTDNEATVKRSIGNMQIDYKFPFMPELRANLNVGYDYFDTKEHNNKPEDAASAYVSKAGYKSGNLTTKEARGKSQLIDFYLNYVKNIDLFKGKIDLTAGYSWQHFWRKGLNVYHNIEDKVIKEDETYKNENYLLSFFGRANITFYDKYLLTVTVREDGSSRFSKDNRWGFFPSAALAWKMKEETIFKNIKMLSDLKLRLGYGVTGQQDIGDDYYPYIPVYVISNDAAQYPIGNTYYKTLRPNGYNPNLKWEETTTYNVGLDFGLFNDRITGSIDYYKRTTKDLLNFVPVSMGANFTDGITTNVGNVDIQGVELTLNIKPIATKDISWNIGFNISYNKNEITKLTLNDDPNYTGVPTGGISGGYGNNIQRQNVGYAVNSFFVLQQVYDPKTGLPAEGIYVDNSGKGGTVDNSDKYKIYYKKPAADVLMGISSRFAYKNFDFSFSSRISLGNYVYNNVASSKAVYSNIYLNDILRNIPTAVNDTKFNNFQLFSDYYVENGSFFKMDNMSIGYLFDKPFATKLSARLSFTVQNVFTITKYSGLDPEISNGIDNNLYPRPRVFILGLNIDF